MLKRFYLISFAFCAFAMRSPDREKSVLSNQNAVPILVYLYEQGGSSIVTHILKAVSNYNSIRNVGARLERVGLIRVVEIKECDPQGNKKRYTLYELTEEGMEVAKHLKKAEDLLKGLSVDDFIPASGRSVQTLKEE